MIKRYWMSKVCLQTNAFNMYPVSSKLLFELRIKTKISVLMLTAVLFP